MASDEFEAVRERLIATKAPFGGHEALRAFLDEVGGPLPEGVEGHATTVGGVNAEWAVPSDLAQGPTILYLHGGGYIAGSPWSHHNIIGHLAVEARSKVLALDYRLAPEHPHPAAVEDALAAYRWLLDGGRSPSEVAVVGDSAGGGLTVALLMAVRNAGLPQPAAAVAISPFADMTLSGESMVTRSDLDVMVSHDILQGCVDSFVGSWADARDSLASPVFGDLSGLAPLLIQVGDHEVLLSDSERLAEGIRFVGGEVTLDVWPEMCHVWHDFAGSVPEADRAIADIAEFLEAHLERPKPH